MVSVQANHTLTPENGQHETVRSHKSGPLKKKTKLLWRKFVGSTWKKIFRPLISHVQEVFKPGDPTPPSHSSQAASSFPDKRSEGVIYLLIHLFIQLKFRKVKLLRLSSSTNFMPRLQSQLFLHYYVVKQRLYSNIGDTWVMPVWTLEFAHLMSLNDEIRMFCMSHVDEGHHEFCTQMCFCAGQIAKGQQVDITLEGTCQIQPQSWSPPLRNRNIIWEIFDRQPVQVG